MKEFPISALSSGSLHPLFVGSEQCACGHRFGPFVRSYYLIHFCLSGKGKLWDKHGEHNIKAGELFVIRPDEVTVYAADDSAPWQYCWIAFTGEQARVLDHAPSVFSTPAQLDKRLLSLTEGREAAPQIYLSLLFELFFRLFYQNSPQHKDPLPQIREYINYNYMKHLRVSELASSFGFERSYLYRIFKQRFGIGVKEYITQIRMEKAKEFLKNGYTVCETAQLVGYEDTFNFSRGFKKHYGTPPVTVRKQKT